MSRVYVITPAVSISGGPELCHQLVDALNTFKPGRASVIYFPWGSLDVPRPYRRYDARPAVIGDVQPGDVLVVPETYSRLLPSLPDGAQVFYWWMSVNNFHREAAGGAGWRLADIRRRTVRQLYQSEYARVFCESTGLEPAARLSDYLSAGFINAIADPPGGERRNLVAYNPLKGLPRTQLISDALAKGLRAAPDLIAIKNLSPGEVRRVFSQVKVYIDFGEHPGKDRLPREAAACGACVITNRRGAAGNQVDVPIPAEFKINDRKAGFERRVVSRIHQILDDFDRQQPRFDDYRRMIAAEPAQFVADAAAVFERCGCDEPVRA